MAEEGQAYSKGPSSGVMPHEMEISEKMSEAYWSLETQSRPLTSPDPNNEYLSAINTYYTKVMDTLLENNASSELVPDVWHKLLQNAEEVRSETFAAACMSENMPIKDTAHTRAVSRMFWGVIDDVSSIHNWWRAIELMPLCRIQAMPQKRP
jgi:hypothetical protein